MGRTVGAISLGALLLVCAAHPAWAALNAQGQKEVTALLTFVGSSTCTFIRNGSDYDAKSAQDHLKTKLDYLQRKQLIDSAEDFIARAASTSSMSGKPYMVRCDGHELASADWLRQELQRMRQVTP
ncbi:DUF5329 domain-containing protein [Dyella silvatica]|uniref:DUF5329 domain-containing protein n=1 Tax=Dyella silvatica TaxID=2992128 RepID=UPI00225ACD04|nr:DUF5329 domain-containing protein [Dyella silvatica]